MCVFCIFCKVYEILFENQIISINNYSPRVRSVADPNLQLIRGGAGGSSRSWEKGWGQSQKKNFSGPFGPRVWSTNKRGPSPGSASGAGYQMANDGYNHLISNKREWNNCFIKNAYKISMNLSDFILLEQAGKDKGLPLFTCHTSVKTLNARTDWMNYHEWKINTSLAWTILKIHRDSRILHSMAAKKLPGNENSGKLRHGPQFASVCSLQKWGGGLQL